MRRLVQDLNDLVEGCYPDHGKKKKKKKKKVEEQSTVKVSKKDADYRMTTANQLKGGVSCKTCEHFQPGDGGKNMCAVIEGPVEGDHTSNYWKRKM